MGAQSNGQEKENHQESKKESSAAQAEKAGEESKARSEGQPDVLPAQRADFSRSLPRASRRRHSVPSQEGSPGRTDRRRCAVHNSSSTHSPQPLTECPRKSTPTRISIPSGR